MTPARANASSQTEKRRSGLGARDLSQWQAEFRLERALQDYISQKNGLR